jgi:hypothetical protein
MKSYNLFNKQGFVKLEDEKEYVTFKSVGPTVDTDLHNDYPYCIDAIEKQNGVEAKIYFVADEKAMDKLVEGEVVPMKMVYKYNSGAEVRKSVVSCKVRLA